MPRSKSMTTRSLLVRVAMETAQPNEAAIALSNATVKHHLRLMPHTSISPRFSRPCCIVTAIVPIAQGLTIEPLVLQCTSSSLLCVEFDSLCLPRRTTSLRILKSMAFTAFTLDMLSNLPALISQGGWTIGIGSPLVTIASHRMQNFALPSS